MIHIGAIRKIFRGWRILICAWVDDNSPLKSQFFMLFRGDNGKEYIRIGKGYDPKTDTYPRMVVTRWSIIRYVGERHWEKSFVWFGLGKFIEITADGWKTDVTINGKTYSERHIGHYGSSECVEGNFEEDDEIPESIYDALNDFFCFGCQQALAQFEIEEGIEEE